MVINLLTHGEVEVVFFLELATPNTALASTCVLDSTEEDTIKMLLLYR